MNRRFTKELVALKLNCINTITALMSQKDEKGQNNKVLYLKQDNAPSIVLPEDKASLWPTGKVFSLNVLSANEVGLIVENKPDPVKKAVLLSELSADDIVAVYDAVLEALGFPEPKQESFPITSVSREDLESKGFDTTEVSDLQMERLASKMADDYCEQLFWSSMDIIAESLGFPKIEN